jgi:copper chaperone CopZ
MTIRREIIKVYDMTCTSCENAVEKALIKVNGVISVVASYSEQEVAIEYYSQLCTKEQLKETINKAGYNTKGSKNRKYVGLFVIVAAILLVSNFISNFDISAKLKQNLSGSETNGSQVNKAKTNIENGVQVIRMTADNNGYTLNSIYVQKDIPVKLIIEGNQLNSCNNGIVLPSFNIDKDLKLGKNVIEFTPKDEEINFSCWMGMIKGVIEVTDNINFISASKKY